MFSQKDKALLSILAHKLFSANRQGFERIDWDEVLKEADQQAVLPFVMSDIKEKISGDGRFEKYKQKNAQYDKKSIINLHYHHMLHHWLQDADIPYVIIKGAASAYYYKEPLLRCSGDVDFLIKEQDKLKVNELLSGKGFVKNPIMEKHEFHWAYEKNGIEFEMHWDLPGLPEKGKERMQKYVDHLLEQSCQVALGGGKMVIPDKFHHGIIILLHTISHLTGGGIGLRHLCDWLAFENSLDEAEFLELFQKPFMDMGLWKFAKVLTKIGVSYLGCDKREWCENVDDDLCEKLLEDILDAGNFGYKDDLRKSQSKLIRKNDGGVVEHNSWIFNLLANMNYRTSRKYDFLYRSVLLRPIGWLCVGMEYLLLVLFGERNNVFNKKIIHGAQARQKVYEALRLFEAEED
ncbi:MAG: nucleotidyltransferase family protein [Lachnospiraceae bacterium]|nr:nucleotidyltransferase family protein [Lachnospiraceae bacterium]MBR6149883.1 nucleotidyltransferase family protein [Lachnospiraceae bacterium]